MLYGISLIAGMAEFGPPADDRPQLAERLPNMSGDEAMVLALAGLMIMVGLAFKLSAVPFHFWCPDVFEGATAEVNAFLSVASKAAALGLLVRVVIGIGVVVPPGLTAGQVAQAVLLSSRSEHTSRQACLRSPMKRRVPATRPLRQTRPDAARPASQPAAANLAPLQGLLGKLVALLAMLTCTFGNLAAYGQTNIKRLLAYSTIAHAGYMMMAIPPVMALATVSPGLAEKAVAGLAIYIVVYLFMNLGAFTVVAFLRNAMRSEQSPTMPG